MDCFNINTEKLREDLIDFFGTALINDYAIVDIINVETCTNYDLIRIALENHFDLDNYIRYTR